MNNSASKVADLSTLLASAKADDNLSPGAALSLDDFGTAIQAGLGISVDDVSASEAICMVFVLDDSSSIRFAGNTDIVRDCVNSVLTALAATKQAPSIFVQASCLNKGILYSFKPIIKDGKLDESLKLTSQNYNPNGGTPLFDTVIPSCGTALAKCQEFGDAGVPTKTIIVIFTDGEDCGSKLRAEDCKPVISDLLRREVHIVSLMGVDDGQTDFVDVAARMGIPTGGRTSKHDQPKPGAPNWVLTPGSDASSIRRAWDMVSQSAVRASQARDANAFSQVSAGGFGG